MEKGENKDKENNQDNIKENDNNQHKAEIINVPKDYQYEMNFKIIVIGDSGVGKTCITNKAISDDFTNQYNITIGMEIFSLFLKLDNKIIKLNIWDTCGQEIYRSLITNFYRNSSLAILVYSIDNKKSFQDIDLWIKELKVNNSPDTKLILVGNKADLEENREVQYVEGKKFAENYEFLDFFETSAKTGENIKKLFIKSASVLYAEHLKYKDTESVNSYSSFRPSNIQNLDTNRLKKKNSKGCC